MNAISWILFGLIVGIISHTIDPQPSRGGLFGAMLLGVSGAVVGGYLADSIFGVGISGFDLASFLIATAGSMFLLFMGRALRRI